MTLIRRMTVNGFITSILLILFFVLSLFDEVASLDHGDIALTSFQEMLYSEINDEIERFIGTSSPNIRKRSTADSSDLLSDPRTDARRSLHVDNLNKAENMMWDAVVEHGWFMAESSKKYFYRNSDHPSYQSRNLQLEENVDPSNFHPFLACIESSSKSSAFQRLEPMLKRSQALFDDVIIVRNDPEKTCCFVSMEYEVARNILKKPSNDDTDELFYLTPMTDVMKIQQGTLANIYTDSWSMQTKQRVVMVGLSAGHRLLDKSGVKQIAQDVVADVRSLGCGTETKSRKLKQESLSNVKSVSEMFSLTSSIPKGEGRRLRRSSKGTHQWKRALQSGLEASHGCHVMFKNLNINAHPDNRGFEIVLNPSKKQNTQVISHNDGIENGHIECADEECSALNKHCVASLIMALSTHPLVISVEIDDVVMTNDYESQWITQSKTEGSKPLQKIGVDGSNQIISIIDSGLDINHKFFGPTNPRVFDQWDHSQRKVVRYDHSIGDKYEPKGGHGTKVAGAALGKSIDDENHEANGVAAGAKLHVFDIQQGTGGYRMPSAFTLFESMHSTEDRPARIANGSWNTRYRAYPFSCRFFDEALHGTYQGDLYIASAGNDGLDSSTNESRYRTIGNPASCKNTLAVGASQSHGDRVAGNVKGIDNLAAFSSRGPTYDGRMKPDIVAPGASVLTAYAHESGKTVQAYGTSFAAPVVAGNAALVRQYFEDGKLPCNWKDCAFDPSGALVKAVLMNSGEPLKKVQVSRPWMTNSMLEDVTEYDDNQGMGLVVLDRTLPIPGHNKINAVVRNNKVINDGEYHDIFIRASPMRCVNKPYRREFRATLAWYDPAGTSSCAKCLINDLDIVVQWISAAGVVKSGSEIFPNGATHKDFDNNVERIRFNMQGRKRYRIRIKAANLATAKTQFSMIASGCFKIIPNPSKYQ